MDKFIFETKVRKNRKFGQNDFVLGRIVGIQSVICDDDPCMGGYNMREAKDGSIILVTRCTTGQYARFAEIVQTSYPGLCKFNHNAWRNIIREL